MFGDYEAQRHWMEITYNLPLRNWWVVMIFYALRRDYVIQTKLLYCWLVK